MKTINRATAWFVILAFVTLLQVSAMPLRSTPASTAAETSVSAPEQGPGVIEEEGAASAGAKKKSILPLVLIGVGVAAVAVLALVVLKTKYNIVGTWTVNTVWNGSPGTPFTLVFTGDKKSGTFKENNRWNGSYTVDGKNAEWRYTDSLTTGMIFTGTFTDKDTIEGTQVWPPSSGTFKATRVAAATGIGSSNPGGLNKNTK
jgi:hypothetical protein